MKEGSESLPIVLPLSSVDRLMIKSVGGKAANLGDMLQAHFPIPDGFVVTAEAYQIFLHSGLIQLETKEILKTLIDQLENMDDAEDLTAVRDIGARLRKTLHQVPIPDEVVDPIERRWRDMENIHHRSHEAWDAYPLCVAVRSSATAEDLPNASFAGQYDTYLNIVGYQSLLRHIKSCWISFFTDRAIIYRLKNKFSCWKCSLCVIVQKQINPIVSGIMFTADVVTGRRNVTVIDAGFGLGEALVSGLINPDVYRYDRKSGFVEKRIGDQEIEVIPVFGQSITSEEATFDGTETVKVEENRRKIQKLTGNQISDLVFIGNEIQRHYGGKPQDIEWCVERGTGKAFIVQSRPVTTLFPLPESDAQDLSFKVYLSLGHVQVMMDPIRPCGRSVFKHLMPIGRDLKHKTSSIIVDAGCYLYVNVTRILQNPFLQKMYLFLMRRVMNSIAVSLDYVMEKEDFRASKCDGINVIFVLRFVLFIISNGLLIIWLIFLKPNIENVTCVKSDFLDSYMAKVRSQVRSVADPQQKLKKALHILDGVHKGAFEIAPFFVAGFISMGLLRKLLANHAKKEDLDAIERGLSGNVTTEMNLEIGDISDVAREEPKVMDWLKAGSGLTMDGLYSLNSGDTLKFRASLQKFLDHYGSRANSEIDISRPRWRDDPSQIFQVIRGNLTKDEKGHHRKHHQKLIRDAQEAANRIVISAPWYKRMIVRRLIRTARVLMALREHPKFLFIQVLNEVRQVVLEISSILVNRECLETEDDVWFLTLDEVVESLSWSKEMVQRVVSSQKELHAIYSKFKPPAVLTSEGECVNIHPNRDYVPPGALPGLGVSSGVAEGIAKVVKDPRSVVLHSGEILVAQCTDPGWTPLFINASGVVMEVGGYLTHGSVISREYNIPAVSCVANATSVIKTGMRLRVDGSNGFVEILSSDSDIQG
jgi:phosphohistidine swiveling domain-containing protein